MRTTIAAQFGLLASLLLTAACGMRLRSYDKPPQRGLLEDRWPGYYFDQVNAAYSLALYAPAPSLRRDLQPPIPVVSSNPDAAKSISATGGTAPNRATVAIEYLIGSDKPLPRTLTVTLHWPRTDQSIASGQNELTETRVVAIGFPQIKDFLEESGEFRVDRDVHFFRHDTDRRAITSDEKLVPVQISVSGPSAAADVKSNIQYQNVAHLYQLVGEAWPGAR